MYKKIIYQILFIMRLTIIILILGMMQVSATGFAQKITYNKRNVPLAQIFKEIRKQTGYIVLWSARKVNTKTTIDADFKDATVKEVLDKSLEHQPLTYEIDDKTIIIKEKSPTVLDKIKAFFSAIDVQGKVVDEQGLPLPGATAKVKDGSLAAVTNKEGDFFLKGVPEDAVLMIVFMGYKPLELKAVANLGLIKLEQSTEDLQEVTVSTGFWTSSKELSTSNIGKVDAKTIEKQPVLNPLSAIQGRIPGVSIQHSSGIPGSDVNIEIRGRNSLRPEGNAPLYVIDGVPFSMEKTSSSYNTSGILGTGTSPLAGINPADIESIEILKDADATAIYGSRGANGVILITTKRGKAGTVKTDVNVYSGFALARTMEMMNTQQYLAIRKEAFANDGLIPSSDPSDPAYAPDLTIFDQARYTNWQKELLGKAVNSTSAQLSVSGGSERTQFAMSGGYRREDNAFPGDFGFQKGSFHLSGQHHSANRKLSLSGSFSGSLDENRQTYIDISNRTRALAPNSPALYNYDGTINRADGSWENPLAALYRTFDSRVNTQVVNVTASYKLLPDLIFRSTAGYTGVQSEERGALPSTFYYPIHPSSQSSVIVSHGTNQSWIIEPQLDWQKKIATGHLSTLIGASLQGQHLERMATEYKNFPSNELIGNLSSAIIVTPIEYLNPLYRYNALFGRVNYVWEEKYILNLTGRRDGSSRFGPGKQFANFGAIGAAWIFSKEKWANKHLDFLSFGKLRGSYGITGSDQIGNYQYLDTYAPSTGSAPIQYQDVIGLEPTKLFNADFAWERNEKLEGSVELGFMSDRINLSVAFYRNRSSNQLIRYTLPLTTGFADILSNFPATVENRGWEFELNTVNFKKGNWSWTTNANFSLPRNELIAFPDLENSSYSAFYTIGRSIYDRKIYGYKGVDPQTGLYSFEDMNGDGQITDKEDRLKSVFLGKRWFGGLNNNFQYKSIELELFFELVNQTGYNYFANFAPLGWYSNQPVSLLNETIWRKPGDVATIQKLATENDQETTNAYRLFTNSSAAISNASYARLKNLSLSYALPQRWLKQSGARIYFQGQNLLVITDFNSVDPESQYVKLAPLKVYTFGFQLTL